MELVYTQNFEYQRNIGIPRKQSGPKRSEMIIAFLRYARPFLLLDLLALGIAFFLYAVQKGLVPSFAAAIFPYALLCFLLPKTLKRGLGGRYARCIIFTHLLFFVFFLVWFAVEIFIQMKLFHILGFVGAGCVIVLNNAVALPVMYTRHQGECRAELTFRQ